MAGKEQTVTISWAVLIIDGENKTILEQPNEQSAKSVASKYNNEVPLFGVPVIAKVLKRKRVVTVEYSKWVLA